MELRDEMIEKVHALGAAIKDTAEAEALKKAEEGYNTSTTLSALIMEYNIQTKALEEIYTSDEGAREDAAKSIEERLNALYEQITADPAYVAYASAKEAYDALFAKVMEELQFAITGERPCSHDCSSCHGCH